MTVADPETYTSVMKPRVHHLLLAMLALGAPLPACGAGDQDVQQRQANPNIPREGVGAGGDIGATPQNMPGGGRGSFPSQKGKQ
jgi:hypothetical protein